MGVKKNWPNARKKPGITSTSLEASAKLYRILSVHLARLTVCLCVCFVSYNMSVVFTPLSRAVAARPCAPSFGATSACIHEDRQPAMSSRLKMFA